MSRTSRSPPPLPEVDWSPFDKYPESTCRCNCGVSFRSHAKYVMAFGLLARVECPGCKRKDALRAVYGDTETQTIKGSSQS